MKKKLRRKTRKKVEPELMFFVTNLKFDSFSSCFFLTEIKDKNNNGQFKKKTMTKKKDNCRCVYFA